MKKKIAICEPVVKGNHKITLDTRIEMVDYDNLKELYGILGCDLIQPVPVQDIGDIPFVLLTDEEAKLKDDWLPSFALCFEDGGGVYDVVAGPFAVVKDGIDANGEPAFLQPTKEEMQVFCDALTTHFCRAVDVFNKLGG